MSRGGGVTLDFADGKHTFRLAIGELQELQEKTNKGPERLFRDTYTDSVDWMLDDVRETLRLGLIGGGMKPLSALKLIERYFDLGNKFEMKSLANAILVTALLGTLDEETAPGKPQGKAQADI